MEKKYQLPKKPAEKWLKALRSGKYNQGEGTLYQNGEYCCLGVFAHANGISNKKMEGYGVLDKTWNVPEQLKGSALEDNYNELVDFLVTHNDGTAETLNPNGEQWNFHKIADWIEQNVKFI